MTSYVSMLVGAIKGAPARPGPRPLTSRRVRSSAPRTAMVTDARRGSALAVIRSLGRRGWRVIGADSDRRAPGLRSRYTTARALYADPGRDPSACRAAIEAAVERHGVDLLVPVTDEMVHVLTAARDRLESRCCLALPRPEALGAVLDKSATLRLARSLDIPVPRSRTAHDDRALREAAEELGWPVVLKSAVHPYVDADGRVYRRPVCYAADRGGLECLIDRFRGAPVIVQEFCRGTGCGVEMLADRGRVLAAFQHRRLAEIPVSGGASAWRESVALDPELYGRSSRLVESLCWTGLVMVEFKVHGDDARLMEINGRVWGSLPLAIAAGMDFPARLAELMFDGPGPGPAAAAPATGYRVGVQAFNLELMVLWLLNVITGRRRYPFLPYPPRRAALRAIAAMFGPRACFDAMSRDDPRPGLAVLGRIIRKLFDKVTPVLTLWPEAVQYA